MTDLKFQNVAFVVSGLLGFDIVSWSVEGKTRGLASSCDFLTIENKGTTIFKKRPPTYPPTTLPNKQRHIQEHFTNQEKCAFTLHRTENNSLSMIVYFTSICSKRWSGCGGRDYESPNTHCTLCLLNSRPVNFASLRGLQFFNLHFQVLSGVRCL
jgi:hypothetical protein